MNDLQLRLMEALQWTAERFRKAALPTTFVAQLDRLAGQVDQPCVVAVVGRVNAGKSTFINALLGENLAKVGAVETTATINYFRYGVRDPEFPVRCHWNSGKITDESQAFLDSLQGNDMETLRKADGIDYLEYRLPNHYLEQITLVDTPGIGAVVDEHQNRTAEFLQLYRQLRERHDQDTRRIGDSADAVIYLIGATARLTDEAFLREFQEATRGQSRALNAIGVMAKIDYDPAIIERRDSLARKIAEQFQQNLNTVIPVSAGIQQALEGLLAGNQAGLSQMMQALRRVAPETLDELLADAELYLDTDCPLTVAERKALRGEMQWPVFTTIARLAAEPALDQAAIADKLAEIAGFAQLHQILNQHFVQRGIFLRCYRIVIDAMRTIDGVKFTVMPEYRKREAENKARQDRFLALLRQLPGTSLVRRDLEVFIEEHLAPRTDLGGIVGEVEREIGSIKYELEDYNVDFDALQQIEDHPDMFTLEEQNELRALLGLHGLEIEKRLSPSQMTLSYIGERQAYWERRRQNARNPVIRMVAEQAIRRYGLIADTII